MIYLVTNNENLTCSKATKLSTQESIAMIESWPVVQYDCETTGLDPHVNKMTSMQFGYRNFKDDTCTAIVVDTNTVDPLLYKTILESKLLIGHNLKFDLQFLYNYCITPLKVYDTMICEQLLYLGYSPGSVSFNLHDVVLRNTGTELDKSFQSVIAQKGLTEEGIIYAANDVVHLQDVRKAQMTTAKMRQCEKALIVENRCVPAMAYLEWSGIHLDEEKWKAKMEIDKQKRDEYKEKLDEYVRNNPKLSQFVSDVREPSLFSDVDSTKHKVNILWSSQQQVIPVLQALGFKTRTVNKKTKKETDSAVENFIANQKGIADDFLEIYFEYKGWAKNVSSYGQIHLNLINPNTGRLHTIFKQIGTVTGRMSSGSSAMNKDLAQLKKLPKEEVRYINLQNLPARGEYGKQCRACFTSEEGNVFVSCDYSAEESRVQADVWNEQSLLDAFENGIDTHNLYAKMCFPEELKDVDVRDVKHLHPELRQKAKSAEFAVAYGSDGTSIAENIGMSVDNAREMVKNLIKGMPGMTEFKKRTKKFLSKNGYLIINEITGHRAYWQQWATWKAMADRMDQNFMIEYQQVHKGTGDEVDKMVKRQFKLSHPWFEKNVLNYPIQGGSAVILKQAVADLFTWIVNNNYFSKVLLCVLAHDEIDIECPKEIADTVSKKLQQIMQNAAALLYKRLPIPAEVSVGDHWIH